MYNFQMADRIAMVLVLSIALVACGGRELKVASDVAAGFQPNTFLALDGALREAVENNEVPGAVIAVGRNGIVLYERAAGYRDLTTKPLEPMTTQTLFDVASLTKPVATSAAAAMLICRGEISPGLEIYRDSLDAHLRHATQMPTYMDWRAIEPARAGASPVETMLRLIDDDFRGPQRLVVTGYSNTGYILVGAALEEKMGMNMERWLKQHLWGPLGMRSTTYAPSKEMSIARTTKELEPGQAYDPLAAYLLAKWPGHAPGHSGLFSTGKDLTLFAQGLLYPEKSIVSGMRCVSDYMFLNERADEQENWGIVLSSPKGRTPAFEADYTMSGSPAFYQTGYTGTLLWMDPESGTSLVLLTNSVHSDAEGWASLRREAINIIKKGLGEKRDY